MACLIVKTGSFGWVSNEVKRVFLWLCVDFRMLKYCHVADCTTRHNHHQRGSSNNSAARALPFHPPPPLELQGTLQWKHVPCRAHKGVPDLLLLHQASHSEAACCRFHCKLLRMSDIATVVACHINDCLPKNEEPIDTKNLTNGKSMCKR